jgi:hypothetical protein
VIHRTTNPRHRLVALVVLSGMLLGCASTEGPSSRRSDAADGSSVNRDTPMDDAGVPGGGNGADLPPFDRTLVPAAPVASPSELAGGADPVELAEQLAAAVADPAGDPSTAWRSVYAALDVPVLDAATSVAVADPVGPTWDQVWSVGRLSTRPLALPSDEAERLIAAIVNGDATETVSIEPGTLLNDLRTLASSADPRAVFLGRFLAARTVARGLPDPLDPATTPSEFVLDPASIALVVWASLRSALPDIAAESASAELIDASGFAGSAALPRPSLAPPSLCSAPTDEESWVLFLEKIAGGGFGINGLEIPGISSVITKAVKVQRGEEAAGRASVALGVANLLTSIISALAAFALVDATVTMDPSPLERLKEARDGKQADVKILISFTDSIDGAAAEIGCALNVLSRAIGGELSIPAKGTVVAGADVVPDAGRNVPDKVLYNISSRALTTDSSGVATLPVIGKGRKKDLPDSARPVDDTFSIRISAQFEGVSIQGILDTFMSGLSVSILGGLGAAVNVLKTVRYDLGTYTLPLKDWELESYVIDQPFGALRMSGTVCGLSQPFQIDVSGEINGSIVLTPTSDTGGNFVGGAPEVMLTWTGTFVIDRANPDAPTLIMAETASTVDLPQVGPVDITGEWWSNETIALTPDPSVCGG